MYGIEKDNRIRYEELPQINGQLIESIFHYSSEEFMKDHYAYAERGDWYFCKNYFNSTRFRDNPDLKVKNLPPEFAVFFDPKNTDGRLKYVSYVSFCVGNHPSNQQVAYVFGLNSCGQNSSLSYYRERASSRWVLSTEHVLGQAVEKVLKKKFKVEVLPSWHGVEYKHTHIQVIDNIVYPRNTSCWERQPYIALVPGDRTRIRVYYEPQKAHYYLEHVKVEPGDEGLVMVDFPRDGYQHFCHLSAWNESKEEDPNGVIRWNIGHPRDKHWNVHAKAMIGDKEQFSKDTFQMFYRIVMVTYNDGIKRAR